MIVGLLHPGEMGASVGRALQSNRHEVLWASDGRSSATRERAQAFRDTGTVEALAGVVLAQGRERRPRLRAHASACPGRRA